MFLFTLPNLFWVTIPMSVLVGILLGLSRLAADSEIIAMRASGLGIGYFVRVASIVAVAGALLGTVQLALACAPRQPGHPRHAAVTGGIAGVLPDSAARLLRGLPRQSPLRAGRALRHRRVQLGADIHGRRERSGIAEDHHCRIGHRGQRFRAGTADAAARTASSTRAFRASPSSTTSPPSPQRICL